MSDRRSGRRLATMLVTVVVVFHGHSLSGQTSLSGLVRDSTGHSIVGAEVSVEALGRTTYTDDSGRYVLRQILPGTRLLRVRRVGFGAFSRLISIDDGPNTLDDIVLDRIAVKLDSVVTRDHQLLREDPSLREMEENRKVGLGHFITRGELAKQEARDMSNILLQIPALQIARLPARGIKFAYVVNAHKQCPYQIFLDNSRLSKDGDLFNINEILASQVEAIEVYDGPAQAPPKYSGLGSQCGVVVFHTRRPP